MELTQEGHELRKAYYREYSRKKRRNMTDEQREKRREYKRKWDAEHRENNREAQIRFWNRKAEEMKAANSEA